LIPEDDSLFIHIKNVFVPDTSQNCS